MLSVTRWNSSVLIGSTVVDTKIARDGSYEFA